MGLIMDSMYLREKHSSGTYYARLLAPSLGAGRPYGDDQFQHDHDYHNILHLLGAVHILRQPKPGVPGPPPPPSPAADVICERPLKGNWKYWY